MYYYKISGKKDARRKCGYRIGCFTDADKRDIIYHFSRCNPSKSVRFIASPKLLSFAHLWYYFRNFNDPAPQGMIDIQTILDLDRAEAMNYQACRSVDGEGY